MLFVQLFGNDGMAFYMNLRSQKINSFFIFIATSMPQRFFKISSSIKMILMTVVMVSLMGSYSFGRGGVKLYSIGANSAWNSATSWSYTSNGLAAGIVPQANDSIIIETTVIQNVNFSFSENGFLSIAASGYLRGENMDLDFSGNSTLKCNGELKTNNLTMNGNAAFIVEGNGKILVKNSFTNISLFKHVVSGKLTVTGIMNIGTAVSISGNGIVESVTYSGTGSVFGILPASSIPDGSLISEYNWVGTLNNTWSEPLNWSGSFVPVGNSNISILSSVNHPIITDEANCEKLFINSAATLIVNPAAILGVTGNLSVIGSGKLILKNTVSSKSSLILNGEVSGKIQAEYPVVAGQKNLVSSPVDLALSGTFINMYLRSYNEASSQWGDYIIPTTDLLTVMQGYELFSLFSETRTFVGTPDNNPKSISISNSGSGLNLAGNPFPCFIDWENTDEDASQRNAIAAAIYYPDPSGSGNFSVFIPGGNDAVSINNGSRYIAPMQGFFVKAGKPGSLTLTEKSRVRNYTDSKVAEKNNSIRFKLSNSNGFVDEVLFRIIPNSSFDFDDDLDALKLKGNDDSPSIHLKSAGDVKYAVNTIPVLNSSVEIPLNIECSEAGMYSVSSIGAFNFEYRYPVILEDKELSKFIDLRVDSAYAFYHNPMMNSERFVIHFNSTEGIDELIDILTIANLYPGEVRISGDENTVYTATLFTTDGKLISTAKGILSEGINLNTGNQANRMCVLQLSDGKKTMNKKILTQ
jgi:hypothetical protein